MLRIEICVCSREHILSMSKLNHTTRFETGIFRLLTKQKTGADLRIRIRSIPSGDLLRRQNWKPGF
jgi:hypothetical protein